MRELGWCSCVDAYDLISIAFRSQGSISSICEIWHAGVGRNDTRRQTHKVLRHVPVLGSQNLIRLSFEPDTRRPLFGCHCTQRTSHPCPMVEVSFLDFGLWDRQDNPLINGATYQSKFSLPYFLRTPRSSAWHRHCRSQSGCRLAKMKGHGWQMGVPINSIYHLALISQYRFIIQS